ncbi:MAG: phage portal protein [Phycisphaera sp.]|nr:phage portal protein [Phycisphaera sp.]
MWMTDNAEATIEQFGGDGPNPSEDAHINEVREAMDKTSAVTAVAAGLLRSKVGNLTSENALRITMMGLLAKTEKKRITYGKGIERVVELVLHALHVAGVLETSEDERRVRLHWPSPLPEDESQRLRDAEVKLRLGVPKQRVLAELGYGESDD